MMNGVVTVKQLVLSFVLSHQMLHFFEGFIADVDGQLNSCANSCELETAPTTRNFAKLCESLSILRWVLAGRL